MDVYLAFGRRPSTGYRPPTGYCQPTIGGYRNGLANRHVPAPAPVQAAAPAPFRAPIAKMIETPALDVLADVAVAARAEIIRDLQNKALDLQIRVADLQSLITGISFDIYDTDHMVTQGVERRPQLAADIAALQHRLGRGNAADDQRYQLLRLDLQVLDKDIVRGQHALRHSSASLKFLREYLPKLQAELHDAEQKLRERS
ncbi:hypothetical protein SLS62_005948 [Diatrype stigma]|uniref:Uncharacterized protein n=1 Tax=Diatrype stigma TaxID=117547 RepID=A0AAN9YPB8_9PEZI